MSVKQIIKKIMPKFVWIKVCLLKESIFAHKVVPGCLRTLAGGRLLA